MGCSVNHAQMSRVEKVLTAIISKGWLAELAMRISAAGMKLVADEFKAQQDPYRKPWAPLAKERPRNKRARLAAIARGRKPKGQKILQDTGRMKNSVGAVPRGNTARLTIPTWYAAVHQNGAYVHPHTRLASYGNVTYRVGNRFASMKDAAKAHRRGDTVHAGRYRRTYSNGIRIPQRMMLPNGDLPARWQRIFEKESNLLLAQKMEVK